MTNLVYWYHFNTNEIKIAMHMSILSITGVTQVTSDSDYRAMEIRPLMK